MNPTSRNPETNVTTYAPAAVLCTMNPSPAAIDPSAFTRPAIISGCLRFSITQPPLGQLALYLQYYQSEQALLSIQVLQYCLHHPWEKVQAVENQYYKEVSLVQGLISLQE